MNDPALDHLDRLGIDYGVVEYGRVSSAEEAAAARGISLEQLVKTLVVRRGENDYVFVLVTGTTAIDWKKMRSALGVRRLSMPDADQAKEATGYARGTITPLGASNAWPVYADRRVAAQQLVSLGSGRHGRAVNVDATKLLTALGAAIVDVSGPIDGVG
jgi:Cys-tRNA(Pro) deacylase